MRAVFLNSFIFLFGNFSQAQVISSNLISTMLFNPSLDISNTPDSVDYMDKVLVASFDMGISIYAYLGYLSLFIAVVYGIKKWQNYKLDMERNKHLQNEQKPQQLRPKLMEKSTINKSKEEIEKEKMDLEKELQSTKIQLVIKAKENEDKKKVLQLLGEKLRKIQDSEVVSNMKWKEIFRVLESHQQRENNTFQIHMDELNQKFTQKLKITYPSLTIYDLRLCTYIKTGLSTREIAEMMHVLPSSINVSRSRLRKKLNLDIKDDLFSFLEGI